MLIWGSSDVLPFPHLRFFSRGCSVAEDLLNGPGTIINVVFYTKGQLFGIWSWQTPGWHRRILQTAALKYGNILCLKLTFFQSDFASSWLNFTCRFSFLTKQTQKDKSDKIHYISYQPCATHTHTTNWMALSVRPTACNLPWFTPSPTIMFLRCVWATNVVWHDSNGHNNRLNALSW